MDSKRINFPIVQSLPIGMKESTYRALVFVRYSMTMKRCGKHGRQLKNLELEMWNYRIMKSKCPRTGELYYTLNEVFYHDDGRLKAYSERDEVMGDTKEEIISILEMMLSDAKKDRPILTEADFKV